MERKFLGKIAERFFSRENNAETEIAKQSRIAAGGATEIDIEMYRRNRFIAEMAIENISTNSLVFNAPSMKTSEAVQKILTMTNDEISLQIQQDAQRFLENNSSNETEISISNI